MGIFTRVRDIISSNLNAMLDMAEDPEKLVKLMVREMEDTLVEVKASCAGAIATKKRIESDREVCRVRVEEWAGKARLAVEKNREDLAREALLEKRRYQERAEALEKESAQCESLVAQYQCDITQLEERLETVKERERVLVERHIHAQQKKRAQADIRKIETSNAFVRFETLENRIEQMEAEADLVNFGRKPELEDEFTRLLGDEELEKELATLKAAAGK
ncbi:MAG: PspA/IM30 family protein [Candidatus Hydrogenedentes bacterium]|nr:PspA/IM30 family protein [Candidatus Hydrogenedentota bacterium]